MKRPRPANLRALSTISESPRNTIETPHAPRDCNLIIPLKNRLLFARARKACSTLLISPACHMHRSKSVALGTRRNSNERPCVTRLNRACPAQRARSRQRLSSADGGYLFGGGGSCAAV